MLKCIIIDNNNFHVTKTRRLLLDSNIGLSALWPESDECFNDWSTVWTRITELRAQGFDPTSDCCILLLDLALDTATADRAWGEGVSQIVRHFDVLLRDYVVVALTMHADQGQVRDLPHQGKADGVVHRSHLESKEERSVIPILESALHKAIEAWRRRTGRDEVIATQRTFRLRDSAASRIVDAAIGAEALSMLVAEVAEGWEEVSVEGLSGGYSGSFVVRVRGTVQGVARSAICKVSRDREVLADEIRRWRGATETYQGFSGLIPPIIETGVRPLGAGDVCWYFVQAEAGGKTLANFLRDSRRKRGRGGVARIQKLVERLLKATMACVNGSVRVGSPTTLFSMSPIDVERFEASLPLLLELGEELTGRGAIGDLDSARLDRSRVAVSSLAAQWAERLSSAGLSRVEQYQQHGDLNARNVLVDEEAGVQLIDFARFGFWPVCYDLVRLELQIQVRGLEVTDAHAWFAERLGVWRDAWREPGALAIRRSGSAVLSVNHLAVDLISELRRKQSDVVAAVSGRSGVQAERLPRAVMACYAFDALKICSYQDISPFQRLNALLILLEAAENARII